MNELDVVLRLYGYFPSLGFFGSLLKLVHSKYRALFQQETKTNFGEGNSELKIIMVSSVTEDVKEKLAGNFFYCWTNFEAFGLFNRVQQGNRVESHSVSI